MKEELEKVENEGSAPEKLGLNEDGVYDSADYRSGNRLQPGGRFVIPIYNYNSIQYLANF